MLRAVDHGSVMAAPTPSDRRGAAKRETGEAPSTSGVDRVEVSTEGRLQVEGPVRSELVARVRAAIADGTYLTAEKIDVAVDRLSKELDRG